MLYEQITLSPDERDTLRNLVAKCSGSPFGSQFDPHFQLVKECLPHLPSRLALTMQEFGHGGRKPGAMLISGFPLPSRLPLTPWKHYEYVSGNETGTEDYLLLLAACLGPIISFSDWHDGAKIQNLYPLPESRECQCAANSVYLEMHTETAFRPQTPYFLLLLCLREGISHVQTILCDLQRIVDDMDEPSRAILRSARFAFPIAGENRLTEAKPIDSSIYGRRRLNYAEALVGTDEASSEVLTRLQSEIRSHSFALQLRAGQMAIINNLRMIHGRTAFAPNFDGSDRWLQRTLVGSFATAD